MQPTNTLRQWTDALLSLLVFLALSCLSAYAGPRSFTENQFPVWYATQSTPVSITNAAETILFQTPLPASVMGNLGFLHCTAILDGDAGSTNKVLTYYIGGPGFTNATALATNTWKQTTATPVNTYIFPYIGGFSNLVYSTLYTNFNAGALKQTVTVGTQTNGLFFTITGSTADTHGTYLTLDAVIVEALGQ